MLHMGGYTMDVIRIDRLNKGFHHDVLVIISRSGWYLSGCCGFDQGLSLKEAPFPLLFPDFARRRGDML